MTRRPLIGICLLVLALGSSACGGGERGAPDEHAAQGQASGAPPARQAAPPAAAVGGGGELPEVPAYPGAREIGSAEIAPKPGSGRGDQHSYETADSPEEVSAFYDREMVGLGWEKLMSMPMEQGSTTTWVRDNGQGATVSVVARQDGTTHIAVTRAAG